MLTLIALPVKGTKSVTVFCPFCKKWHYHGKGDGHRVADCPGDNAGYYIKEITKMKLKQIGH